MTAPERPATGHAAAHGLLKKFARRRFKRSRYFSIMIQLQNDRLQIDIDPKGAELKRIFHKTHEMDYMWDADPGYWAKTSPVLFPIVGALKDGIYYYKGRKYSLPRHGFAREKTFTLTEQHSESAVFSIESDADTLAVYPFHFTFSIRYTLEGEMLSVEYRVRNTQREDMFFSVGGHPAFKIPLVPGTSYEDYSLIFEKEETAGRWPISKDGLIEKSSEPLLQNTNGLPLNKELFSKDALVFKDLKSRSVQLASGKTPHGLRFNFPGFPYLGLWAAPGADFLCIEPWCGIADSVDASQQLQDKEGIQQLPPEAEFKVAWQVQFF